MGRLFRVLSDDPTPVASLSEAGYSPTAAPARATEDLAADDAIPGDVPAFEVGAPRLAPLPRPEPRAARNGARAVEPVSGHLTVAYRPIPNRPPQKPAFDAAVVAYHEPDAPAGAQYRTIREAVAAECPGSAGGILFFASALPRAGTTTVVLNLAVALARDAGERVLVVDANAARPAAGARLGVPNGPGWRDALARSVPLAWCLHRTGLASLHCLPVGGGDAESAEAATVVRRLREQYARVLIDGGTWGWHEMAAGLADASDAAFLTVRHDDLDAAAVEAAHHGLLDHGGGLRGYLVTRL
jgi:Mrp family chromosome partitioning ATPase